VPARSPLSALTGPRDRSALARAFEHRSGRIIALCRTALAAVFFLALWLDPTQPTRSSTAGYIILLGYLLLAAAMLAIAWRDWWWDHRLAWPIHVVDVVAFLAAVYFTETTDDDFTSPFLAFFAFLMLSATIRWDWRDTVLTGVTVTVLYLLVGLAMSWSGIELDVFRFGRRVTYMLVLSLILVWFGLQRRHQHVERFVEPPGSADDRLPPMIEALRYAMAQSGAQSGAIAWADDEEPHMEIRAIGLDCPSGRLAPGVLPPEAPFAAATQLFSVERQRSLHAGQRRSVAVTGLIADPLAEHCRLGEGLALPFEGVTGRGEVLLGGIPGACADHVEIGQIIAREIGVGFDRQATLSLVRESALARMRDAVARDLHDTIAQSLAGVSLRLEGLRQWIRTGGDPESEIQAIKAALRAEQAQVREMIERLKRGDRMLPEATTVNSIGPLLRDLAGYWGIAAEIDPGSSDIAIPGWLAHQLRQLLREAVANAVRHGDATKVTVAITEKDRALHMHIGDNGTGFSEYRPNLQPRSISERVAELGGALTVTSTPEGAVLRFVLPLEAHR
jgi:signal transduction histidine kinase